MSQFFETINLFLSNSAIQSIAFGFWGQYIAEKGLDNIIQHCKNKLGKQSLEYQLIDALNNSLQVTCNYFQWEYDPSSITDTFIFQWESYKSVVLNLNNLNQILINSVGHKTIVTDEVVEYWASCFLKELSDPKRDKLYKYTILQQICLSQHSNSDKNYEQIFTSDNANITMDVIWEFICKIIWNTNPYDFTFENNTPSSIKNIQVLYKENCMIHKINIMISTFLDEPIATDFTTLIEKAEKNNTNILLIITFTFISEQLKQEIFYYSKVKNIAIILKERHILLQYAEALNNSQPELFNSLRSQLINIYCTNHLSKFDILDDTNDYFVDRFEERKILLDTQITAFFIQGVSLCGKTTLVKNVLYSFIEQNYKIFWHTIYQKQDESVINASFWNDLTRFFLDVYQEPSLAIYFKENGNYLTDKLIMILEMALIKHKPILVIDNVHNCHKKNEDMLYIFSLIVTKKLCRIYFIGWFNIFSYSEGYMKKINLGGMEPKYLNSILNHYTGTYNTSVANSIYNNLSGLPGYAVIFDPRIPQMHLATKNDILEQILTFLNSEEEKIILFALSIASIPIPIDAFNMQNLYIHLENLKKKHLVEKKAFAYTVHDNYKTFFSEYIMDIKTLENVLVFLKVAATYDYEIYLDIINLYLKHKDFENSYDMLNSTFMNLIHKDYFISLLEIIQILEVSKCPKINYIKLIINKIIIYERISDYHQCQAYLQLIEDLVSYEDYEYENLLYIKLRCMYFNDQYDEILYWCDTNFLFLETYSLEIQIQIFLLVGRVYYIRGDLENALIVYLICFEKARSLHNTVLMIKSIHRIAMIECSLGFVNESLITFKALLERDKEITGRRKSFLLYRIAKCYYLLNDYNSAKQFCEKSIEIKKSFGDLRGIAFVNKLMAKAFFKEEDTENALMCIEIALNMLKKIEIVKEEVAVKLVWANILFSLKYFDKVESLLIFCLKHSIEKNLLFRILQVKKLADKNPCFAYISQNAQTAYENAFLKNTEVQFPNLSIYFIGELEGFSKTMYERIYIKKTPITKLLLMKGNIEYLKIK